MKSSEEIKKMPQLISYVIVPDTNSCVFYRTAQAVYLRHCVAGLELLMRFSVISRNRVYLLEIRNESGVVSEKSLQGSDDVKRSAAIEVIRLILGENLAFDEIVVDKLASAFL